MQCRMFRRLGSTGQRRVRRLELCNARWDPAGFARARPRDRFLARSLGGVGFYLHKELRARGVGIVATQRNYVLKIFRAARAHLF